MSKAVEEVLATWREAERLLDELPPVHPDHETVRLQIAELRRSYERLTAEAETTPAMLAASHLCVLSSRAVFERARGKIVDRSVSERNDP